MTTINDHEREVGGIVIDDRELEFRFIRASGPGGQNVNKVATAVQLRFDAARSPSLPDEVRARLIKLAGRRATSDGGAGNRRPPPSHPGAQSRRRASQAGRAYS